MNTVSAVKIVRLRHWLTLELTMCGRELRAFAFDFAQAVERHDRVVERVTDDREQRGDDREIDLEGFQLRKEAKPGIACTM